MKVNVVKFLFLTFATKIMGQDLNMTQTTTHDRNLITELHPGLDFKLSNCSKAEINPVQPVAILGWPYTLLCERLAYDDGLFYDYVDNQNAMYQCLVWTSEEKLLFNHTNMAEILFDTYDVVYEIPEVKHNESRFIVYIKNLVNGKCFYSQIEIKVKEHVPQTCEEYLALRPEKRIRFYAGRRRNLECFKPSTFNLGSNVSAISFQWFYNCNKLSATSDELTLKNIQPSDSGIYTCSASYNGISRFIHAYHVCVSHVVKYSEHTAKCKQRTLMKLPGETAVFECSATYNSGNPTPSDFDFTWQRGTEKNSRYKLCTKSLSFDSSDRLSCVAKFYNTCLRNADDNEILFQFTIKNITETDYGPYLLKVMSSTRYPAVSITLTLQKYKVPFYKNLIFIVGISIAVLLTFVFLSMIAFYNSIYIKVCMKRLFWKQESNNKKHGVFLAYHYSSSDDKFAKQQVKEAILKIKTFLEEKGFTVCDENILFNAQGRAELVQSLLAESHRILIILSSGFIKDDWSLFSLQKGFNEMIESGTRIIFLVLPGVKEHLRQKSVNETSYEVIERSLKTSYVIRYPESAEFFPTKFLYQLEYALPKLKRKKTKTNGFELGQKNGYQKHENEKVKIEEAVV